MKKMFPPGYQNNSSVPIHILGHMNRTSCAQVHGLQQSHCGNSQGKHIVFMITYRHM